MRMVEGVVVHYASHALLPPLAALVMKRWEWVKEEKRKRRKGRKSKEKGVNKIK